MKRRSRTESEVPLYLVPQAVTRKIRDLGGDVYRISVKRTHWHHYNVTVRTKSLPPELLPRSCSGVPAAAIPDVTGRHAERGEPGGCEA